MHEEFQYLNLMKEILENGVDREDRTGTGTLALPGLSMKFSLEDQIPVLTTKKVFWRGVVEELLFFIRGETDTKKLEDKKIKIWKGNTSREFLDQKGLNYPEGELGPGYGFQWRNWDGSYGTNKKDGFDQLHNVVEEIKNNPYSRRLLVSAWNANMIDKMALAPCHYAFQFYVDVKNKKLHCILNQRSADMFLGVPFNISSYALLTYLIAEITDLKPGSFTWNGGDCHIYKNHVDQVKIQLQREPYPFPKLKIHKELKTLSNIETLEEADLELLNYQSHSKIKADMAV